VRRKDKTHPNLATEGSGELVVYNLSRRTDEIGVCVALRASNHMYHAWW
jgi:hypothetical protein